MYHTEKKIQRTSLDKLTSNYSCALLYQAFPMNTSQKEQIKTQIIQVSPTSLWKLSTKYQKAPFQGPLFYIFNNSWENLQIVYDKLQSNSTIQCIGAKYENTWVSRHEINVIFQSKPTLLLENLLQKNAEITFYIKLPVTNLINVLDCYLYKGK